MPNLDNDNIFNGSINDEEDFGTFNSIDESIKDEPNFHNEYEINDPNLDSDFESEKNGSDKIASNNEMQSLYDKLYEVELDLDNLKQYILQGKIGSNIDPNDKTNISFDFTKKVEKELEMFKEVLEQMILMSNQMNEMNSNVLELHDKNVDDFVLILQADIDSVKYQINDISERFTSSKAELITEIASSVNSSIKNEATTKESQVLDVANKVVDETFGKMDDHFNDFDVKLLNLQKNLKIVSESILELVNTYKKKESTNLKDDFEIKENFEKVNSKIDDIFEKLVLTEQHFTEQIKEYTLIASKQEVPKPIMVEVPKSNAEDFLLINQRIDEILDKFKTFESKINIDEESKNNLEKLSIIPVYSKLHNETDINQIKEAINKIDLINEKLKDFDSNESNFSNFKIDKIILELEAAAKRIDTACDKLSNSYEKISRIENKISAKNVNTNETEKSMDIFANIEAKLDKIERKIVSSSNIVGNNDYVNIEDRICEIEKNLTKERNEYYSNLEDKFEILESEIDVLQHNINKDIPKIVANAVKTVLDDNGLGEEINRNLNKIDNKLSTELSEQNNEIIQFRKEITELRQQIQTTNIVSEENNMSDEDMANSLKTLRGELNALSDLVNDVNENEMNNSKKVPDRITDAIKDINK